MKDNNDIQASIRNAIIANTTTKLVYAIRDPDDAAYLARVLFLGFIDYAEYKQGTERPVVVGHHKEIVKNRSRAHHTAEHQATSETESVAIGTARTHMLSVTEAEGESDTDATSQATALGSMNSESSGSAVSSFDGTSFSQGYDPTSMNFLFAPPTITSVGTGSNSGTGLTDSVSRSAGSSATETSGSSHAHSTSRMSSVTEAVGTTESEVHGYAKSRMRGTSKGLSESAGDAETFVPTLEWLPSQLFSAGEQHERLTGEIMNLAHRELFVKVGNQRPVRTRTTDLQAAFRSAYCRRVVMPVFHRALIARSPYLRPIEEIDALIASRTALPPPPPEPDFTAPEPVPFADPVHDVSAYARDFWKRKTMGTPKKPPGRRPKGELTPDHDRFRVVDGDRDDGDNER